MTQVKHRAMSLIYGSDLHATRFLLGLAELIWALALFWPGDTFSRPTYTSMAQVADEEFWAVVFLTTSFMQFHILLHDSYYSAQARVFAAWNAVLWIYVAISMYMSVYPPPAAISGELAMAVGASWIFVRGFAPCVAVERRHGVHHA